MKRAGIIALIFLVAVCGAFYAWRESGTWLYATETSPDGRFRIEVYGYPRFWAAPGDSSGAPGDVRLIVVESGKIIERKSTEMVMLIETVRWNPTTVDIKLFTEWNLPQ